MMFAAPPELSLEWSDAGVEGASRFLRRVWRLAHSHVSAGLPGPLDLASLSDGQKAIRRAIHQAIRQASIDIGQFHKFNTADRKSTRLNSSHVRISYAVFCL